MKKFFALVLALVMALSLTTVAWGADHSISGNVDPTTLTVDAGNNTVTLTADVDLTGTWTIDVAGAAVTLDLGGHSLTGRINLKQGTLTVKNGTLDGSQPLCVYGAADATVADYAVLNVESDVTISNSSYGICVFQYNGIGDPNDPDYGKGSGIVVNMKGKIINTTTDSVGIFILGNIGNKEGVAVANNFVNVYGTINVMDQGIAMNGAVTVNVYEGASITGSEAIGVKRGTLNVYGGTLTGNGGYVDPAVANTNGTEDTGAAISVTSTYNDHGSIAVNVEGGTIVSEEGVALYVGHSTGTVYEKGVDVDVSGGDFTGAVSDVYVAPKDANDNSNYPAKFISGGTFSVAPDEDYLADGLAAVLVNGEYVLQEPANVSVNKSFSNVDTEDWVVVDLTTGTAYDIAEDAEVNKIVYKDIKKTVNGKTTTQYGVTLYGPLTFEGAGAAANGGYAMVVAKESANMQLETAAGKIIFARFITADEYAVYSVNEAQYAYTTLVASEFVEEADDPSNCEDPFLSYYVVGDYYYVVSDSNADNTLIRYKNEFVIVGQKLDFEPLVPHTFMYDEDACKWSSKDNELVSVKCTCGDTFKIVQDIRGLKAGSYYSLGTGDYVILKATSTSKLPSSSTTTSSSTVTSAPTFDAGIAMYVGMSVMAAAGSAVVIGKKKD